MASELIQRRIETLLDEADEAVANSDWAVVRDSDWHKGWGQVTITVMAEMRGGVIG